MLFYFLILEPENKYNVLFLIWMFVIQVENNYYFILSLIVVYLYCFMVKLVII